MKNMSGKIDAECRSPAFGRAVTVLRSILFTLGLILITLGFTPLGLATLTLPYAIRYRVLVQWALLNSWWLGVTCGLRHRVVGLENITERAGIVLCKHESAWEVLVLPGYFSPQTWVLKRELLSIPFFGWGLATLRPIAINRADGQRALKQVLEQGAERLAEGLWVVVFPEGALVVPGKRRRYRPGGAALAEATGRTVVPVAHNAGDYWPRGSFVKRPGTIQLVIGEPIETAGRSAAEINVRAAEWIESTVAKLRYGANHRSEQTRARQ